MPGKQGFTVPVARGSLKECSLYNRRFKSLRGLCLFCFTWTLENVYNSPTFQCKNQVTDGKDYNIIIIILFNELLHHANYFIALCHRSLLDILGTGDLQVSSVSCHGAYFATATHEEAANLLFVISTLENRCVVCSALWILCTGLKVLGTHDLF